MNNERKYSFTRKPVKCPVCNSMRIARILYGMPLFNEEQERKLDAGKIVLGGCIITPEHPVWRCIDCERDFYRDKGK